MNLRRKALVVAGVAFGVAILIPVMHHYQLAFAESFYLAKLQAEGEHLDLAQAVPPPLPADQNCADAFLRATALFEADKSLLQTNYIPGMKMVARGKAAACLQRAKAEGYPATNSWEEVAAAVRQNRDAFQLLQQLIAHPNFDFQVHYERGFENGSGLDVLHLIEIKWAAQKLATASISDLHEGDTAGAMTNLRALLGLTKATGDERLVVSDLIQMTAAAIAAPVTWEVLQSPNVTDEQLAQLQNDWNGLDFAQSMEKALQMERAMDRMNVAKWRSSNQTMKRR